MMETAAVRATRTGSDGQKLDFYTDNLSSDLSQAKDKAQLTATTAMSIINVGMLREILRQGPDDNKFYTMMLVMISITLALQVAAGMLSLMVSHMRIYYNQHQKNVYEWFLGKLRSCCRICGRKSGSEASQAEDIEQSSSSDSGEHSTEDQNKRDGTAKNHIREKPKTPRTLKRKLEQQIAQLHFSLVDAEEKKVESEISIKHLEEVIASLQIKIAELENVNAEDLSYWQKYVKAEDDDGRWVVMTPKRALGEAQWRKEREEAKVREFEKLSQRNRLLQEKVDEMERGKVLRKIGFWQQMINYSLYCIFVLNMFVTGLGFVPI